MPRDGAIIFGDLIAIRRGEDDWKLVLADLAYGRGEAMKPIRLCQHSVVVLVISFAVCLLRQVGQHLPKSQG